MFTKWFSKNKQEKEAVLIAPLTGKAVPLESVPDPVFSQKIAGDGIAIEPTQGKLVSPVNGKVGHIFHTAHALVLQSEEGLELLIHIGLDTVKLNGQGFTPHVKAGDEVKAGDVLIEFDLQALEQAGYKTVTPVLITNLDKVEQKQFMVGNSVTAGSDKIMELVLK
ncbi:PTS sugar transporter subunit IIA [Brevibacillus fluminis]|uniref:PTS sugar transporter subunit IIA n=1 Tax=Brevibacillus fluminis TaxID=511487 RepID=UPI003F88CA13